MNNIMRIRIIHSILLLGISTLKGFAFPAGTGASMDFPVSSLPDSYNESYILLTDRNMYAVGEKILFSVFNTSPPAIRDACWSRVIYVHLLKTDGTTVAKEKFPLGCSGASGFLSVPDDLLTGNYYLCAYTKWMRNFSPSLFSFAPLIIINPFNAELDRSSLPVPEGIHSPDTLTPEAMSDPGYAPDPMESPDYPDEAVRMLECMPDKASYVPGEEIHLSIRYPGGRARVAGRVCLSVAREGSVDTLVHRDIQPTADASWSKPVPGYLPEIDGLSLSGRILAGDPPEGIGNARVELSVFGNRPGFMAYKTHPDGSFYYRIDSFAGSREMFIAACHPKQPKLELRIDNDFASPMIRFPEKPFYLSEGQAKSAREIMLNMQLDRLFRPPASYVEPGYLPDSGNASIHGLKVRKLLIDDYIELPNLKEVFIELFPEVQPVTRPRKTYLNFLGNELTQRIISSFEPLILVDRVPVYDIDKFLAMVPKRIHSIEVIDEVYVIGNIYYGGLINIVSKNGDMGGIDLPENSLFFRYRGFPDITGMEILPRRAAAKPGGDDPDPGSNGITFRNCLYWEPDLSISPEETRNIGFYCPDQPGMYRMILRGVAEDGSYLYGQCNFRIAP
jgi:hypothetical protein